MPMQWVPPAPFLTYKGRTIYRAYKDQGEIMLSYWFNADQNEEEEYQFDVRGLNPPPGMAFEEGFYDVEWKVAATIIFHMENGDVVFPGYEDVGR